MCFVLPRARRKGARATKTIQDELIKFAKDLKTNIFFIDSGVVMSQVMSLLVKIVVNEVTTLEKATMKKEERNTMARSLFTNSGPAILTAFKYAKSLYAPRYIHKRKRRPISVSDATQSSPRKLSFKTLLRNMWYCNKIRFVILFLN